MFYRLEKIILKKQLRSAVLLSVLLHVSSSSLADVYHLKNNIVDDDVVAENLAFPYAQGFGRFTQGGKNGKVYIVTSLLDQPEKPLEGTLRHAIKQKHPRIILFSVSGIIKLQAPLKIEYGYLTIAGQSSPGGIAIVGAPVSINEEQQIILQHLRFRLGTFGYADDALSVRHSENIIIDHCSLSWSVDETASFYNNRNFTLQNSMISHSLNHSIHPKGDHGYGGIWGGANASFINNVIANHASRTPRINGHRLKPKYPQNEEFIELINNTIFNWGHNNVYGSENGRFDLINNYYKPGKASTILQFADIWYSPNIKENQTYLHGNVLEESSEFSDKNWLAVNYRNSEKSKRIKPTQSSALFSSTAIAKNENANYVDATVNFNHMIKNENVGANRNANGDFIDSVDQLVYQQLRNEVAIVKNGLIDHEFELISSWENYEKQFQPIKPVLDVNNDGIDDNWMKKTLSTNSSKASYNELLSRYLVEISQ